MPGGGVVVTRPILLEHSVNHTLPSGPAAMKAGRLFAVGTGNSVISPAGVIRPIWFALISVNHRFPSEPEAMSSGSLFAVGTGNSIRLPEVLIRPILFVSL